MLPIEHSITNNADTPEEERHKRTISRRKLLKALAAAGGAVAVTTLLPSKWAKPVVEVGVLPVHAQATAVAIPTATPRPLATIILCSTFNAAGGTIGPTDTIGTYADITHPTNPSGIQLRRIITLNEPGHLQDGIVSTDTGPADATGRFQPPDFNLSTLSPTISPGSGRITILWEFVNPADGTNTCQNNVEIV
ncbi:MAG: twin-arginine translocation signal domain-containing protein [Anaerolineae bacterium]